MSNDEPFPGAGTSDLLERKFNTCQAMLYTGRSSQMLRKQHEAMFYMGAEAMYDLLNDELAELDDEEIERELARIKNAIWRKAQTLRR